MRGTVKLSGMMRALSLKGGPPVRNQGVSEGPPLDAQGLRAVKRCTGRFGDADLEDQDGKYSQRNSLRRDEVNPSRHPERSVK